MALLADGLAEKEPDFSEFRCFTNPGKKRNEAALSPGIGYAADALVLLAYLSLEDDVRDDGGIKAKSAMLLFRSAGRKAAIETEGISGTIEKCLSEITNLEKEYTSSLDRIADPFGRLMSATLEPIAGLSHLHVAGEEAKNPGSSESPSQDRWTSRDAAADKASDPTNPFGEGCTHRDGGGNTKDELKQTLAELGYQLGRYIYTIDAIDDFGRDTEEKKYNPFCLASGALDRKAATAYMKENKESINVSLNLSLAKVADALEKLPLKRHRGVLENIVFLGMNAVKDEILAKAISVESETNETMKDRALKRKYLKP
jgi:hypothetical protein